MREEIIAGLRNAIARGQGLQQAVQSFINAGYNAAEVKAAAEIISRGATSIAYPATTKIPAKIQVPRREPLSQVPEIPIAPTPPPGMENRRMLPQMPNMPRTESRQTNSKTWLVILIVFSIFILSGATAYLIYYLVK